jgi:hypothetical protein
LGRLLALPTNIRPVAFIYNHIMTVNDESSFISNHLLVMLEFQKLLDVEFLDFRFELCYKYLSFFGFLGYFLKYWAFFSKTSMPFIIKLITAVIYGFP